MMGLMVVNHSSNRNQTHNHQLETSLNQYEVVGVRGAVGYCVRACFRQENKEAKNKQRTQSAHLCRNQV